MEKQNMLAMAIFAVVIALTFSLASLPSSGLIWSDGETEYIVSSQTTPIPWINFTPNDMTPNLNSTYLESESNGIIVPSGEDYWSPENNIDNETACPFVCDECNFVVWCYYHDATLDTDKYTFNSQALNPDGNSVDYNFQFIVDLTPPLLPVLKNIIGETYFTVGDVHYLNAASGISLTLEAEQESTISWDSYTHVFPGIYNPLSPSYVESDITLASTLPQNQIYTIEFTLRDKINNPSYSNLSLYYDNAAPIVTSFSPANGIFTGDTHIPIYALVSDVGVGLKNVTLIVNNTVNLYSQTCTSNCETIQFDGNLLEDVGAENTTVYVTLIASDLFGQTKTQTWSFVVDSRLPYVDDINLETEYHNETTNGWYTNTNDSSIDIIMGDASNLSDFAFYNSNNVLMDVLSNFSSTDNITWSGNLTQALPDGTYKLVFNGSKKLSATTYGVEITLPPVYIHIDTKGPVISDLKIYDDGALSANIEYGHPYKLSIDLYDENLAINSKTFKIQVPAGTNYTPLLNISANTYSYEDTPTISAGVRGSYNRKTGEYTLTVTASDELGNSNSREFTYDIVDRIPAVITFTLPENMITTSPQPLVKVNTSEPASCSIQRVSAGVSYDMGSDSANVVHDKTCDDLYLLMPSPGEYNYLVNCTDNSGNPSSKTTTITWDNSKPSVSLSLNFESPVWNIIDPIPYLTATADENVVCKYELFFDETPALTLDSYEQIESQYNSGDMSDFNSQEFVKEHSLNLASDIANNLEGEYTYLVLCKDGAGWVSEPASFISFEANYLNYTIIRDPQPADGSWLKITDIPISVSSNMVSYCNYSLNNKTTWNYFLNQPNTFHTINITGVHNDKITVDIKCEPGYSGYDIFYLNGSSWSFGIDLKVDTAKIVEIYDSSNSPVAGDVTADTHLTVGGKAEADSQNITIEVFKDGQLVFVNSTASQNGTPAENFYLDIILGDENAPDGIYLVKLTVTDKAGNVNSSAQSSVELDRTAPSTLDLWDVNKVGITYFDSNPAHIYATAHENRNKVIAYYENDSEINSDTSLITEFCVDKSDFIVSGAKGSKKLYVTDANEFHADRFLKIGDQELFAFGYFDILGTIKTSLLDPDEIDLTAALLADITSSTKVYECTNQYPVGWTNLSLDLTSNIAHRVFFGAEDKLGNHKYFLEDYYLVIDTQAPTLNATFPANNYLGSEEVNHLSATILDNYEVDESTIQITFDDVVYNYSDMNVEISSGTAFVTLDLVPNLGFGDYSANISFADKAGNMGSGSWNFTIDSNVTMPPTLTITGDHFVDLIHYINQTDDLNITVDYDETETVYLDNVTLGIYPQSEMGNYQTNDRLDSNSFWVLLDSNLAGGILPLYLNIHSFKQTTPTMNSSVGKHPFNLIFDLIPPVIDISAEEYVNWPQQVEVSGYCYDKNMDIITLTGDVVPVNTTCNNHLYETTVDLKYVNANNTVYATAYDKAGWKTTVSTVITVDTVLPDMSDVVVVSTTHDNESIWYSNPNAEFNWSLPSENFVIEGYDYIINSESAMWTDTPTPSEPKIFSKSTTVSGLESGHYWFHLKAMDKANNWAPDDAQKEIRVDVDYPIISKVDPSVPVAKSFADVQVQASDEHSGISELTMELYHQNGTKFDGATISPITPETIYTDAFRINNIPANTEELFDIKVLASDKSSPALTSEKYSQIKLDNKAPEIISPIDFDSHVGVGVTVISFTTNENAKCRWTTNSSYNYTDMDHSFQNGDNTILHTTDLTLTAGYVNYYISCDDGFENFMTPQSITIYYDNNAPILFIDSVKPIQYKSGAINYTSSDHVIIKGRSENDATITSYDLYDPSVTVVVDNSKDAFVRIVDGAFKDADGNDINSIAMNTNSTFSIVGNGPFTVYSDIAANPSIAVSSSQSDIIITKAGTYTLNVTLPVINLTDYLTLVVSDSDNSFELSQPLKPDTTSLISFLAEDTVGNVYDLLHITKDYAIPLYYDSKSPVIYSATAYPANGSTTNSTQPVIEIYFEDEGAGVNVSSASMFISKIDDGLEVEATLSCSSTYCNLTPTAPLTNLTLANINVTFTISDNVGHSSTTQWGFTINTNAVGAPEFNLSNSNEVLGTKYSAVLDPNVMLTFSEPVVITNISTNNGAYSEISLPVTNTIFEFVITSGDGPNSFVVTAHPASRPGDSAEYTFNYVVDTINPLLLLEKVSTPGRIKNLSNPSRYLVNSRNITFELNMSDTNLNKLFVTGNVTEDEINASDSLNLFVELNDVQDVLDANLLLTDKALNENSSSVLVELDTIAPEELTVEHPRTPTPLSTATIAGHVSDDVEEILVVSQPSMKNVNLTRSNLTNGSTLVNQDEVFWQSAQPGPVTSSFFIYGSNTCGTNGLPPFKPGNWVQLGDENISRFKVNSCITGGTGPAGPYSKVELEGEIPLAYPTTTPVYEFDTQYPDGWFFTDISLSDGWNMIDVYAFDRIYNEKHVGPMFVNRTDSNNFILGVEITSPIPGPVAFNKSSFELVAETSDPASSCTATYENDGTSKSMEMFNGNTHMFTLSLTGLSTGTHNYSVICSPIDKFQTSQTATISFAVDVTAPNKVVLTKPANGSTTNVLDFKWQDSNEYQFLLEISKDADFNIIEESEVLDADMTTKSYLPSSFDSDTSYYWRVFALDKAGNSVSSDVWHFFFDRIAPIKPIIISPDDYEKTNKTTYTVLGVAEAGTNVTVSVADQSGIISYSDSEIAQSAAQISETADLKELAYAGDLSLIVLQNKESANNTYMRIGSELKLYHVTSATYYAAAQYTVIGLETSLKQNLQLPASLTFYESNRLPGQFDIDVPLVAGLNDIIAVSTDVVGLSSNVKVENVLLDTTRPVIENFAPTNGTPDTTPTITADIYDSPIANFAGIVKQATLTFDNVDYSVTLSGSNNNYHLTYTPGELADGTHNVSLTVYDEAGNSATKQWSFKVDTNLPGDAAITVQSSIGYESIRLTQVVRPNITVLFPSSDVIWHDVSVSGTSSFNVINTTPGQKFTVQFTEDLGDSDYSLTFKAKRDLGSGVFSDDRFYTFKFGVDNNLPEINLDSLVLETNKIEFEVSGDVLEDHPAKLTISGDISGQTVLYSKEIASAFSELVSLQTGTGNKNIDVTLEDAFGNKAYDSHVVYFDNGAPSLTLVLPTSKTNTQPIDVNITSSKDGIVTIYQNGISKGSYEVFGGVYREVSVPLTLGANSINASMVDYLGNTAFSNVVNVLYDNMGPVVDFTYPNQADVLRTGKFILEAKIYDEYLSVIAGSVQLEIDGKFYNTQTQGFSYSDGVLVLDTSFDPLSDGVHTATISATDELGNPTKVQGKSIAFRVDSQLPAAPVMTLHTNAPDYTWDKEILPEDTIYDNIPVDYNNFNLDFDEDVNLNFSVYFNKTSQTINSKHSMGETRNFRYELNGALQEGIYELRASYSAHDNGKTVRDETSYVVVDRLSPSLNIDSIKDSRVRNITITGNCSDINGETVSIEEVGVSGSLIETTCTQYLSVDFTLSPVDEVKELRFTAVDKAGNEMVLVRNVTLDSNGPSFVKFWQTKIYTNQNNVNVIGLVSETNVNVTLYDVSETQVGNTYTSNFHDVCTIETDLSGTAGTKVVLTNYPDNFDLTHFIDFSSFDPTHLGYELKRYDLTSKSTVPPDTFVEVDPALMQDIPSSAEVCVSQFPEGWFSIPVSVDKSTTLWAKAKDWLNNPSAGWAPTSGIDIIYDTQAPTISNIYPVPNTITSSDIDHIGFTVEDTTSPIDWDSITLLFNGSEYDCTSLDCSGGEFSVDVALSRDIFPEADYEGYMWAYDLAGNLINSSYIFMLYDNVTSQPIITVPQAKYQQESTYYVDNLTPYIMLDYVDDAPYLVNLTMVKVCNEIGLGCANDKTNVAALSNQSFNVSFYEGFFSEDNQDETFMIKFYSREKRGGVWSQQGIHSIYIRVDTETPVITYSEPFMTNSIYVTLEGYYQDSNMDHIVVTGDIDQTVQDLDLASGPDMIPYNIDVTLVDEQTEGTRNLTLAAYDKLGMSSSISKTLIYDGTPPSAPNVSSSTHTENTLTWNRNPVFNWTTPTDHTNISFFYTALDKLPTTLPTSNEIHVNHISYSGVGDGTWYFHVRAVDGAGNLGDTAHYVIRIDGNAPSIEITDHSTEPITNSLSLELLASEELSSIALSIEGISCTQVSTYELEYNFNCNTSTILSQGFYKVKVNTTDLAGNSASYLLPSSGLYIDNEAPRIVEVNAQSPTQINESLLEVTVNEDSICRYSYSNTSAWTSLVSNQLSGLKTVHSILLEDLVENANTFYVVCRDDAKNQGVFKQVDIWMDSLPPTLSDVSYSPLYDVVIGGQTRKFTNSDYLTVSGISDPFAKVTLFVNEQEDASTIVNESTALNVQVEPLGLLQTGLVSLTKGSSIVFTSQITPLNVTYGTYANTSDGYFTVYPSTPYVFDLNVIDTYTFKVVFQGYAQGDTLVVDVTNQTGSFSFESEFFPAYGTVNVRAEDSIGNYVDSADVFIFKDTGMPDFFNEFPSTTNNKETNISVQINDTPLGGASGINPDSLSMRIETASTTYNCNYTNCAPSGTINYDEQNGVLTFTPLTPLTSASEDYVTVNVSARDYVNNYADFEWTFLIDTQAPSQPLLEVLGSIDVGGKTYVLSKTPQIRATFAQATEITSAKIGEDLITSYSVSPDNKVFVFDTSLATDDQYTFNLSAKKLGLAAVGSWPTVFTVDTTWPTVTIYTNMTPNKTGVSPVMVYGEYSEANLVSLTVNNEPAVWDNNKFQASVNLNEGVNEIIVRANDVVNLDGTDTMNITLDTTSPEFMYLAPIYSPTALMTHTLKGRADPTVEKVRIEVWDDASYEPSVVYEVPGVNLSPISLSLGSSSLVEPASTDATTIFLDGNVCNGDTFAKGNYIEFGDDWAEDNWVRYKIDSCQNRYNPNPDIGYRSEVELVDGLDEFKATQTSVKVYAEKLPSGYFTQPINLTLGQNYVIARALDDVGLYAQDQIDVFYDDTIQLGLTLNYPASYTQEAGYFVLAEEYDALNGTPIEVETNYPAECRISHVADWVADAFNSSMTPTNGGLIHKVNLSQPNCESTHCYIMGNGSLHVKHLYHIYCKAEAYGLDNSLDLNYTSFNFYDAMSGGDFVCNESQRNRCSAGTAQGYITSYTGGFVEGAIVTIAGKSYTTSSDGYYHLENVPFGMQTIIVSRSGFEPFSAQRFVPPLGVAEHNFEIRPYARLGGVVRKASDNSAFQGVEVTAQYKTNSTNALGVYTLNNIMAGDDILVTASATGYTTAYQYVSPEPGDTLALDDFLLVAKGSLEGYVSNSSGPLIGATVFAGDEPSVITDSNGYYFIDNLNEGQNVYVQADMPGHKSDFDYVQINAGQTSRMDFNLIPKKRGDITGRITDLSNNPITTATVSVSADQAPISSVPTDEFGYYTIENVYEGTQSVIASAQNYLTKANSAEVIPESVVTLNFQLQKPGNISGEVVLVGGYDYSSVSITSPNCGVADFDEQTHTYVLSGISQTFCNLTASAVGYSSQTVGDIPVAPGYQIQVDFILQPGSEYISQGGWI